MRTLVAEVANKIGHSVLVQGWVHNLRDHGGIAFLQLRDRSGVIQAVLDRALLPENGLPLESVVALAGQGVAEPRAKNGVELHVSALQVLSLAEPELPVDIGRHRKQQPTLDTVLNHRPISLRTPKRLAAFKVQAVICEAFSSALRSLNFTEFKSSKLVASGTEGGTNLFYVDYFGRPAYLAQSPQFYKQIMVGSGFERVFEIGPVFRAEPHNTSRHLNEYTSMDFEMGFIHDENDIMDTEQQVLTHILDELRRQCQAEFDLYEATIPQMPAKIPRLRLAEAGDILMGLGVKKRVFHDLHPAEEKQVSDWVKENQASDFVFLTHYPVEKRPMYAMPDPENPKLTRSFDLLFRGLEITTGGQRIHGYQQLMDNMRKFGLDPAGFTDYLECFKYGMPPHGGLAIGLERLTMQLLGLQNVREACLFPRDRDRLTP